MLQLTACIIFASPVHPALSVQVGVNTFHIFYFLSTFLNTVPGPDVHTKGWVQTHLLKNQLNRCCPRRRLSQRVAGKACAATHAVDQGRGKGLSIRAVVKNCRNIAVTTRYNKCDITRPLSNYNYQIGPFCSSQPPVPRHLEEHASYSEGR